MMKRVCMDCHTKQPRPWTVIATTLTVAASLLSCVVDDLTAPDVDPTGITFEVSGDSTLLLGDSLRLTAQIDTHGAGPRRVRWSTSDSSVVTVTDGSVRAVGVGTATVVAQLIAPELKTAVIRETPISVSYASIAIDPVDSLTSLGENRQLVARGLDVAGNAHGTVAATFSALDPAIVSTSPAGMATSRGNGMGRVTGAYAGLSHQAIIRVRQVARTINFPAPQLTLYAVGSDTAITVDVRDASDSVIATPSTTWESSDTSVLTVTPTGVVRALKVAPGVISVHVDTVTAQLAVTVSQAVATLSAKRAASQLGTAGIAVDTLPTVVARDAGGNPVAGTTVTFAIASGNGQVTDSIKVTDSAGEAALGGWTLGTAVGVNTVTASAGGASITFTVDAGPGPASGSQSIITVGNSTVTAGETTTVTLTARDAHGNALTTGGATVVFGLNGGSSQGTFSNQQDNGDGTYTVTLTGTIAGSAATLGATINGIAITSIRPTVTVTTGAASDLAIFAGNGQTGTVNTAVSTLPAAIVRDASGNPVAGITVTFVVTAGAGTLADSVQITGANGVATLGSWTLGTTSGANTIEARWNTQTVAYSATGNAGAVSVNTSTVTVDNGTIASDQTTTVRLTARDQFGNVVDTGGSHVVFATSGGGSTGGFSATTDAGNGTYTATFTGVLSGDPTSIVGSIDGNQLTSTAPTVTVTAGPPSQLTIDAGDNQVQAAGTAVPIRPAVRLRDAAGNNVSGVSTVFTVNAGGGGTTGATVLTDANGVATVGSWSLGTTTGFNELKATSAGLQVLFTATAMPGPPSPSRSQLGGADNSVLAGGSTILTLVARDQFDNPLTTGGASVAFGHQGGTSTGFIGEVTDNGDGSYQATFIGTQAGTATTITAMLNGASVTSTLPTITVTPGTVAQIAINAGDGQTTDAGTAVPTAPSVVVRDASNNAVAGANVVFTVLSGGGNVTGSPAVTDASGIATLSQWVLGQTPGANSIEAAAAGFTVAFNATGTVGPASGNGSTVNVSSASLTAGDNVTLTLEAKDAFGNVIGTGGATVTFSLSGGTSNGTIGIVSDNGDGTYTATLTGTASGSPSTVEATINGQSVTTALPTITVNPGTATQISVAAGNNQTQAVGTTLVTAPGVLLQDGFGNPVPGVSVTFSVSQGDGSITGSTPTTGSDGIATLGSWTLGTIPGVNQLTVIAGTLNTTVGATATVGPVSMTMSTVSVGSGNVTAGDNTTLTLVARDQYGNQLPAGGLSVSFVLSGGSSSGTIGATSDHGNGTYTATFSATTAGTATTVGATINASAVTSTLPTVTVSPGAATQITIVAGDNQTAGILSPVAIPPKVLLRDAFNNVVWGVTVTFTVTQGGGSVMGPTQVTGADGTATVGEWNMGLLPGANALRASAPGIDVVFTATATL